MKKQTSTKAKRKPLKCKSNIKAGTWDGSGGNTNAGTGYDSGWG